MTNSLQNLRALGDRVFEIVSGRNWPLLWYQAVRDHTRPDLIWNQETRSELMGALDRYIEQTEAHGCLHAHRRLYMSRGARPMA